MCSTHIYFAQFIAHFCRYLRNLVRINGKSLVKLTFAKRFLNRGFDLAKVSMAMGHRTTQTTELYYARIKDVSMFEAINSAFNDKNYKPEFYYPSIEV
jgi:integrase